MGLRRLLAFGVVLLIIPAVAYASPGDPDMPFGSDGTVEPTGAQSMNSLQRSTLG